MLRRRLLLGTRSLWKHSPFSTSSADERWWSRYEGLRKQLEKQAFADLPETDHFWVKNNLHVLRNQKMPRDREEAFLELDLPIQGHDDRWESKFGEMVAFYEKHKAFPLEAPHLADETLLSWCRRQRENMKKVHASKLTSLTRERFDRLDSLGFEWNTYEETWNHNYNVLKMYHHQHGDCLVPRSYPENPGFGRWVQDQRYNYRNYLRGKEHRGMSDERAELLKALDFEPDVFEATWQKRYQEYEQHYSLAGARPPKDTVLLHWIRYQRKSLRKYNQGEKSPMTEERKRLLAKVGVV